MKENEVNLNDQDQKAGYSRFLFKDKKYFLGNGI
jgi:hypothetical protein